GATLTSMLLQVGPTVLAGFLLAGEQVALLSVGSKIAALQFTIAGVLNAHAGPRYVLGANAQIHPRALLNRLLGGISIFCLLFILTFYLAGPLLLEWIFGPFYREGSHLILLLILVQALRSLGAVADHYITLNLNPRAAFLISLAGFTAFLSTALVLVSIQGMGVKGFALALLTSSVLGTLLSLAYILKHGGASPCTTP
ncbi:MAG: hypothetical protein MI747_08440, partial [Desulfobacterales bacterium]|nr:hypothetical protein [Desulfobacterales bacterium]